MVTIFTIFELHCIYTQQKINTYSKTCVKRTLSKRQKNGFQDRLSLNTGQKYYRMLQKGSNLQYF